MSSTRIQSLEVGVETSWCMISSATAQPDNAAAVVNALEYNQVPTLYEGQATPSAPDESSRTQSYVMPAEPVTNLAAGVRIQRRQGTLTVGGPLRTIGAASTVTGQYGGYTVAGTVGGVAPANATPFGAILNTCMLSVDTTLAAVRTETTTLAANTLNNRYFVTGGAGDGGVAAVGTLIKLDRTVGATAVQRAEFGAVTQKALNGASDTDVYFTPGMATDPATAETLRTMCTWYPAEGSGHTSALCRARMHGGRLAWLNGIVATKFRIFANGGRVDWEAALDARIIQDADAGAPVDPQPMRGAVCHALGSYAVIGDVINRAANGWPSTPPNAYGYAGVLMNLASFDFTFTPTIAYDARSNDLAGSADYEVTGWDAELTVTMTPHATLYTNIRDMFLNSEERNVCIGFGPMGQGNGGCIWMGAAVPQGDALISEGENGRQVVTVTYKPGRWFFDQAATGAFDTPLRIGLSY